MSSRAFWRSAVAASRFFWHLLHLPVEFYAQRRVGDLQQRQEANANTFADCSMSKNTGSLLSDNPPH